MTHGLVAVGAVPTPTAQWWLPGTGPDAQTQVLWLRIQAPAPTSHAPCPPSPAARLLFCGTLLGKVSIVRQLEPEVHIDGHQQTVGTGCCSCACMVPSCLAEALVLLIVPVDHAGAALLAAQSEPQAATWLPATSLHTQVSDLQRFVKQLVLVGPPHLAQQAAAVPSGSGPGLAGPNVQHATSLAAAMGLPS